MPKRKFDDIKKLTEIVELAELLQIDCDENCTIQEIRRKLKQKVEEQSKYLKTTTGFSVISEAKKEDFGKSSSLKDFYSRVNDCLLKVDDHILPILNKYFENDDVFSVLEKQSLLLERRDYKILVAGESSAGKSSLINLILGEDLLSHHILNTTATICEIRYGAERNLVLHYKYDVDQRAKPPSRYIPLTEEKSGKSYQQQIESFLLLKQMEREKGSEYEKVEITWPHELLKEGVVIIDSPGLGESDHMDQVLMNYLPNAFAFIYVIDVSHAGGMQEDLKKKFMQIQAKVHSQASGGQKWRNLADFSLFICNKWDLVKENERKAVKKHVAEQLGQCWHEKNVKRQILYMSIQNAIKVQEYGGFVEEFKHLLVGMQKMILRAINAKLFSHWKFLDFVLFKIYHESSHYNFQIKSTQLETRQRINSMIKRIEKIEKDEQEVSGELQKRLQVETNCLSPKLYEYMQSKEFEKRLCTWNNSSFPPPMDTWAGTKIEVMKEIEYRFKQLLIEWESKNQFCFEVHRQLVDDFLKRLNLLEEELNDITHPGAEITAECLTDETSLSKSAKILVGATSPLWVPVGIVTMVIGMPVFGALVVKNRLTDNRKLKQYQTRPSEYFTKQCKKFIASLTEEKVLEYAEWMLQKTTETLYTYKKWIPTKIKADLEMVSQLSNETRSRDEVLDKCNPILEQTNAIGQEMLQLAFELCPATVDERDLEWKEDMESVFRGDEFSTVYRGKLKNCGRIPKYAPNLSLPVAVKVFRHPFDESNLRLYLLEEIKIRHLDHKNVAKFYGAIKVNVSKMSKDLKLLFVSESYPKSLKEIVMNDRSKTPAVAFNTNEAITIFLTWAKGIADGLKYIHVRGISHRFLKLESVLVDRHNAPKITDIGIVGRYTETEKGIIYLAPEVLENLLKRKKEADVYSYGIMLWEMWYGVQAFSEIMPLDITKFREKVIHKGYRPRKVDIAISLPNIERIMESCWKFDASERPSARECCEYFQKIIESRSTDN